MSVQHPSVGHVHLKVADLDRAIAFYRDILGFDLNQKFGTRRPFWVRVATTTISA